MADETDNGPQDGGPTEPERTTATYAAFPKFRSGICETGEGSLLEQTRGLVEENRKASVDSIDIGGGETGIIERRPNGTVDVIDSDAFDSWREKPLFLGAMPTITDLSSLISYTNRFKDGDSVIFANDERKSPAIAAVLDYHHSGEDLASARARHQRHVATFPVPLSDEWKAWHDNNGEALSMPEFARFLEDHIVDVMQVGMVTLNKEQESFITTLGGTKRVAEPAKLMELATGLQVFEEGEVQQATKLQSGESQLTVANRHTDGQGADLIIPSTFIIAIPVFRNGDLYQIIVRLRYRKTGQGIMFFYELWRDDRVFDHAFDEAIERVGSETSLPVYRGVAG